jgi:serine/threonine protein kinase
MSSYIVKFNIFYNKLTDNYEKKEILLDMEREKNIMLQLNHPNIVQAFNKNIAGFDDIPYIVMENCNGGDLFDFIYNKNKNKNEPYPLNILINKFVYGIGSALIYLHELEIVHHDIKPENIFIKGDITSENYVFKVGDFGLYDDLYDNRDLYEIRGTQEYLPVYQYKNIHHENNKIKYKKINYKNTKYVKYFNDWYGYFCIIYFIVIRKKLNSIKKYYHGTEFNIYNTVSINTDGINDSTLEQILKYIMSIDIFIFFNEVDALDNIYYKKLHALINKAQPIKTDNITLDFLKDVINISKEVSDNNRNGKLPGIDFKSIPGFTNNTYNLVDLICTTCKPVKSFNTPAELINYIYKNNPISNELKDNKNKVNESRTMSTSSRINNSNTKSRLLQLEEAPNTDANA